MSKIFHCRWNLPSVKFSVGEIFHRWNFPSVKFSVGEIFRRWNFLSVKCTQTIIIIIITHFILFSHVSYLFVRMFQDQKVHLCAWVAKVFYVFDNKKNHKTKKNWPFISKKTYNNEKHFINFDVFLGNWLIITLSFINENIWIHKNCTDQE
jgi:hypothetical protein